MSVIIPTHNRPDLLRNTIKSVLEQNFENYEIIVVDNACSQDTEKIARSFAIDLHQRSVGYICEPHPGLHNARHAGARAAKGDILLYIDDDVVADKDLLIETFKYYEDPSVGCVGGKILPKWEIEPPDWIKSFPKWYLSILDDEDGPKEVQWLYGCNFSIRRELLFNLGGFNPDAFGDRKLWWYRGDGEIGLLRKVHHAGKKVLYNPKAIVWHFIPCARMTAEYFEDRAFRSGIESSYSKYRYSKEAFNAVKLTFHASVFGIYWGAHTILRLRDNIKHKIDASYNKARCLYELRLIFDKDLRRTIREDRWLK